VQGVLDDPVLDSGLAQFIPKRSNLLDVQPAEIRQEHSLSTLQLLVHLCYFLLFAFLIQAPSSFLLV
jgi:hypothetical protein